MFARREARRCRAYTVTAMAQPPPPPPPYYPMPMWLPQKYSLPAHNVPEAFRPAPFVPCLGQANDDDDERRVIKRPRLSTLKMTPEELKLEQARLAELRKQKEAQAVPANEEELLQMEEARRKREEELRVQQDQQSRVVIQQKLARILGYVKSEGLTLDRFFIELMASKDQSQSSWVSRTLNSHGPEIVEAMVDRKPKVLEPWMKSKVADMYGADKKKLHKKLRSDQKKALKAAFVHLQQWQVMEDMQRYAPALWEVLERIRTLDDPEPSNSEPNQNEDAAVTNSNTNTNESSNDNDNQ